MSTLAGNFSFKFSSLVLQHRVFSIPWVIRSRPILCLRGRDYGSSASSSSMPVRYIPKKSRKKEVSNDVDNKNRTTVSNNTSSWRNIDQHGKHKNHKIEKKLLYADAEREEFEVGDFDPNLGVVDKCLVKEPKRDGLEEARISEQKEVSRLDVLRGSEALEDVMELEKEREEMKFDFKARMVDNGIVKEPQKAVVKERRINEEKDIHKEASIAASTAAVNVINLMEQNEEQEIDCDMLLVNDGHVKQPDDVVFKERRIHPPKSGHKAGIVQSNRAPKDIKLATKEEESMDDAMWVMNNELIEEPEELPVEEIRIDPQKEVGVLGCGKTIQDAENAAIQLLGRRAYTAVELKKKLQGKKFPSHIVDTLVNDFQKRGLINDTLYAESYSRSRWSSSTWGPRRIKMALSKKGVTPADSENAIKLVFEEGETGEDLESRLGMSKLSMDRLYVQASKQWFRSHDVPIEKRKSRVIRWLEYRGFGWNVIGYVMKRLESQYPP